VSIEPEKKASVLAPLADEYEPTEADAERVLAKIRAGLAAGTDARSPSSATTGAAIGVEGGKKALVVGLSCLTIALAGMAVFETTRASSRDTAPAPVSSSSVSASPPAVEPNGTVEAPGTAIPAVSVDALPSAVAAKTVTSGEAKAAVTSARPIATDTLEKEARLLVDARRALAQGDGDRALALLDQHAREFPDGWLANDRTAERIVVLCGLGRRAEAVREGRAFLEGRPQSPLTRRVESSCAGKR